jgi:hypothetical protein
LKTLVARRNRLPRMRRRAQANVAPIPNRCQLQPIATPCRFERFQALAQLASCKGQSGCAVADWPTASPAQGTVESVDNLQQERNGFCASLSDPVRGEVQSGRQAGDLHPLVVRPIMAATWSRRRADDLPQPLSRKAFLGRDFGPSGAAGERRCAASAASAPPAKGRSASRAARGVGGGVGHAPSF